MSEVWDKLIEIENHFLNKFRSIGIENDPHHLPNWTSRSWHSKEYRLANMVTADLRESKSIWMMHCCVFPNYDNTAPIFGFDVVAGKNKITGVFHDFSSSGFANHPMIDWFGEQVSDIEWRKPRELPDWAQRIFSPHIIAAGNVGPGEELDKIVSLAKNNLDYYLETVAETNGDCTENIKGQNYYCQNQKLNPHNPRVMNNLGLDEEQIRFIIEECSFPEG